MQTLGLDEETIETQTDPSAPYVGFWKRQFQKESTKAQKQFDWIFGVVLPLICVAADPVAFAGNGLGKGPLLGAAKPFAYLFSFACILMMTGWLSLGSRLRQIAAPIAGLFIVGSIISLCVGVVLLPLSILGMFFLIGFLGFTPFFSSLVYFRNGLRASDLSTHVMRTKTAVYTATLTALFSLVIPYVINRQINAYLEEMVKGNPATIYEHGKKLKYIAPLVNVDALGGHCSDTTNESHRALAEVYDDLSGESIDRIDFHICNDW